MKSKVANFDINTSTYDWCVGAFEAFRKTLGLNIMIHNDHGLSEQGDIFLFNHFARFETIIPPYILHKATGAYCRSVADHALFDSNDRIAALLCDVGAVPNDMPGLLPFLAAEILRGRKVVFFPEGGMVKDRRVMDDDGGFSIYSRTADARRKHHRGAAVLALTLEIFKRRILTLEEQGDFERIRRWVKALGLPSEEALLKSAHKPTAVVPGTITFYPLRVSKNAFSRVAELMAKGLRQQFLDELIVEGNILLKNTDMDIRLGEPLYPQKKWRWWERLLLGRYFKKVASLDDLFDLREHEALGFEEGMLAKCIGKETRRIRDLTMEALYTGITVNLAHLASYLIYRLIRQGRMSIDLATFNKTLYLALKNLQAVEDVYLHRSLYWPDRYRGLIDGHCPELDRYLATAKSAGLVGRTNRSYHFLTPLVDEFSFDEVRTGNPLLVYANEAAPLASVRETVDKALIDTQGVTEQEIGSFLFDDELRAHDWNRRYFNQPRYVDVNARETANEDGAPYLLLPKRKSSVGVLLVHGLLASPAEWKNYAHHLCAQGMAVMGVRLAGHGTSPWDLHDRSWRDWQASIERATRILSAFAEHIIVVGFSTGGALSLMHAATWPSQVVGVASINAPIQFKERKMALVPLIHGLNKVAHWLPMIDTVLPFRESDSEHPDINYRSIPIPALYQLRSMIEEMQKRLPDIQIPVLLIQGDEDPIVHPDSVRAIHGKLATDCELKVVPSTRHGIVGDDTFGAWTIIDAFIRHIADVDEASPQNMEEDMEESMEVGT